MDIILCVTGENNYNLGINDISNIVIVNIITVENI